MNTRTILSMIVLGALAVFLGGFMRFASAQEPGAVADLQDDTGKVMGRATLSQSLPGGGVWIQVNVSGLTPGEHGIHIHATGTCMRPEPAPPRALLPRPGTSIRKPESTG